MADLRELVDLLSQGGPTETLAAGKQGFEQAQTEADTFEARKAALQQKINEAISGKEANAIAGQPIFDAQRSLPASIIGSLSNMQVAKQRAENPKPAKELDTSSELLKQEQIKTLRENRRIKAETAKTVKAGTAGKVTAQQSNAALFAGRAGQAEAKLKGLFDSGFGVGLGVQTSPRFPEIMKPQDVKSYDQARRNFLNAVLRKESGAVISPSELAEGDKQYFPQPNDGPEVLSQKQENRQFVIDQLKKEAGGERGIAPTGHQVPDETGDQQATAFIKDMESRGFKFKGVQ